MELSQLDRITPWAWMQELPMEEFPEPYQTIAREIGVANMLKLAQHFAGTGMYFPKLDDKLMQLRNRRIREAFTGCNQKELARQYHLTERWIYEILRLEVNTDQTVLF